LAICAYLAQTNTYAKIGLNQQTFLLGTLLIFGVNAFFGFRRIESGLHVVSTTVTFNVLKLATKRGRVLAST
jgi:hypothetical protein